MKDEKKPLDLFLLGVEKAKERTEHPFHILPKINVEAAPDLLSPIITEDGYNTGHFYNK